MSRRVGLLLAAIAAVLGVVYFSLPPPPRPTRTASIRPTPHVRSGPASPAAGHGRPSVQPGARISIVLDDFGASWTNVDRCLSLPNAVAIAVIPHLPASRRVAQAAADRGFDIVLHQPMEPHEFPKENPGKYGIYVNQSAGEIAALIAENISTLGVPIVGVNNHMGSRATEDERVMRLFFDVFPKDLFFLDSRTSAGSVAYDEARRHGIAALKNNVFLDHVMDRAEIERSFDQLIRIARVRGFAVAIGHVQSTPTIETLELRLPNLADHGAQLVRVREGAEIAPRAGPP